MKRFVLLAMLVVSPLHAATVYDCTIESNGVVAWPSSVSACSVARTVPGVYELKPDGLNDKKIVHLLATCWSGKGKFCVAAVEKVSDREFVIRTHERVDAPSDSQFSFRYIVE